MIWDDLWCWLMWYDVRCDDVKRWDLDEMIKSCCWDGRWCEMWWLGDGKYMIWSVHHLISSHLKIVVNGVVDDSLMTYNQWSSTLDGLLE